MRLGRPRNGGSLPSQVLPQEAPDQPRDLVPVGLQGEVPGVKEVVFEILEVTLVGLGAGAGEHLIVLAPDDQYRRLVLAELSLPFGVEQRVAAIAEE